jgi:4a-hydroxytetrahydrobiopterin dehydratase
MPTVSTNNEEVFGALQDMPGWHRQGNGIQKTFHFDDFACGARFVGRVADAATAAGRQPAIDIRGGRVTVAFLPGHDTLTSDDVAVARRVQQLVGDHRHPVAAGAFSLPAGSIRPHSAVRVWSIGQRS